MKKEYSDLPKSQQRTYILDNVIQIGSMILSLMVYSVLVVLAAYPYAHTGIVQTDLFTGLLFMGLVGSMLLGVLLGYYIKTRLGLYTDLDLERTERKLQKIKDALK